MYETCKWGNSAKHPTSGRISPTSNWKGAQRKLLFWVSWRQTWAPCSSRSLIAVVTLRVSKEEAQHTLIISLRTWCGNHCNAFQFISQVCCRWEVSRFISGGIDLHSRQFLFDPGLGLQLKCGLHLGGKHFSWVRPDPWTSVYSCIHHAHLMHVV